MFERGKMTIRVKLRSDKKAMIRFGDRHEELWFINFMRSIRDSNPKTHPPISIRDNNREIPPLPKPKPMKVEVKKEIPSPPKVNPEVKHD